MPRAGSAEETRATRGAALRHYLQAKLLALDTPTREALTKLLGEDTTRLVARPRFSGYRALRTVTLRPRTKDDATAR